MNVIFSTLKLKKSYFFSFALILLSNYIKVEMQKVFHALLFKTDFLRLCKTVPLGGG